MAITLNITLYSQVNSISLPWSFKDLLLQPHATIPRHCVIRNDNCGNIIGCIFRLRIFIVIKKLIVFHLKPFYNIRFFLMSKLSLIFFISSKSLFLQFYGNPVIKYSSSPSRSATQKQCDSNYKFLIEINNCVPFK